LSIHHVALNFYPFLLFLVEISHALHLHLLLRKLAHDNGNEQVEDEERRNEDKDDEYECDELV